MKSIGVFCLFLTLGAAIALAQPAGVVGPDENVLADLPRQTEPDVVLPAVGYLTPTGSPIYQPLLAARSRLVAVADPMAQDFDLSQFLMADTQRQTEIYLGTVAAIDTRLQLGAPPMSPILVSQWNEAQAAVDQIEINTSQLRSEAPAWPSHFAQLETMALELQAMGEGETMDGMDGVNYRQLQADADALRRFAESWQGVLSAHLAERSEDVVSWRADLSVLQQRIVDGNDQPATGALGAMDDAGRNLPIFVVTFDRPGVVFEEQLAAMIADLNRSQTDFQLDIVAVAEKHNDPEQQEALQNEALQFTQAVIRALERSGLGPERYALTDAILETRIGSEVRLFLRQDDPQDAVGKAPAARDPTSDVPPG